MSNATIKKQQNDLLSILTSDLPLKTRCESLENVDLFDPSTNILQNIFESGIESDFHLEIKRKLVLEGKKQIFLSNLDKFQPSPFDFNAIVNSELHIDIKMKIMEEIWYEYSVGSMDNNDESIWDRLTMYHMYIENDCSNEEGDITILKSFKLGGLDCCDETVVLFYRMVKLNIFLGHFHARQMSLDEINILTLPKSHVLKKLEVCEKNAIAYGYLNNTSPLGQKKGVRISTEFSIKEIDYLESINLFLKRHETHVIFHNYLKFDLHSNSFFFYYNICMIYYDKKFVKNLNNNF